MLWLLVRGTCPRIDRFCPLVILHPLKELSQSHHRRYLAVDPGDRVVARKCEPERVLLFILVEICLTLEVVHLRPVHLDIPDQNYVEWIGLDDALFGGAVLPAVAANNLGE